MNWLWLCVLLPLCAPGCAHKPAPVSGPRHTKLAVLPPDGDEFPDMLRALAAAMSNLEVPGVTEKVHSKVTLEVVQLAIECIDPTPDCYTAVGRSLSVDMLLFAKLEQDNESFQISATLFNVRERRVDNVVKKTFASAPQATQGSEVLVQSLVSRTPVAARQ